MLPTVALTVSIAKQEVWKRSIGQHYHGWNEQPLHQRRKTNPENHRHARRIAPVAGEIDVEPFAPCGKSHRAEHDNHAACPRTRRWPVCTLEHNTGQREHRECNRDVAHGAMKQCPGDRQPIRFSPDCIQLTCAISHARFSTNASADQRPARAIMLIPGASTNWGTRANAASRG